MFSWLLSVGGVDSLLFGNNSSSEEKKLVELLQRQMGFVYSRKSTSTSVLKVLHSEDKINLKCIILNCI